jgi:CheY-like chemotaxis protein
VRAAIDGGDTVKRLLSFVRGGAVDDPAAPIVLADLLREVAELTAPRWRVGAQAEGRPIELEVEAPADLAIIGSAGSLREALTNLVFNAVDAMPDGGRIRMAARRDGARAVLTVSDTGSGIPPSVLDHIFEPFFSTKGQRGSGLGLAMVFAIVERHNGTIEAASEPGRGTTFEIALPIDVAPEQAQERPVVSAGPPLRILVVDDEPMLSSAICNLLERDGHTVEAVCSGEEALAMLEARSFDAILSDVAMGSGINGWELAARVERRWPTTHFVLSTGFGGGIDPNEALTRGVDRVLSKPYRARELRAVLAEWQRQAALG